MSQLYKRLFIVVFYAFICGAFPVSYAQSISISPIGERPLVSNNQKDSIDYSKLQWAEDLNARTANAALFRAAGGYVRSEHHLQPIHRQVNGKWERIDPTMHPMASGGWHAPNQDFPLYLRASGAFEMSSTSGKTWSLGTETLIMNQPESFNFVSNSGNSFYFQSSNQPIVKEMLALENRMKYNYRLEALPVLSGDDFVVQERIVVPRGYRAEMQVEKSETFWGVREVSYVFILDENNVIQGKIYPAYAIDAAQKSEPGSYRLEKVSEAVYNLEIRLRNTWLTEPSRIFPVLLDPLVVGPIAQWTGGQMPSCITPQQNIDSILVTIPGGITVTSLAVQSSFYADPWTGAIMSMGAMQFSTSCNSSVLYQVQGNTGTQPGTAYLDSANLVNPLLCCIPQSCNSQQFYLRKHLSRTAPGTGCNVNFIRYDPFTTQWPFRAIIYGRTPESYATEWSVPQSPRCSDNCDFTATAYVRYGVPPFTLTHPWQDTVIVQGNPAGCNAAQNSVQFQLTIPDCPIYCDATYNALPVPNPVIVDACGASLNNLPLRSLNIKPAIEIIPFADTVFCAGETLDFPVAHCLGTSGISWSADTHSGTSAVLINTDANLGSTLVYYFLVTANVNGCEAEPYFQPVYVFPTPNISFQVTSSNTFLDQTIDFQNTSTGVSLDGNTWFWSFGDDSSSTATHAQHVYNTIGNFEVCLSMLGAESCSDPYCQIVPIIPDGLDLPNVFTPNNDGSNDVLNLFFDWASEVALTVVNRWGHVMANLTITDYETGWNGKQDNTGADAPEGVYFYRYTITSSLGSNFEGQSFVHLIRD